MFGEENKLKDVDVIYDSGVNNPKNIKLTKDIMAKHIDACEKENKEEKELSPTKCAQKNHSTILK